MKWHKFKFSDIKLKSKFSLIILLEAFCIGLSAIASFQFVLKNYNDLLYKESAVTLTATSTKMESNLQSLADVSKYIATNKSIQDNLTTLNNKFQINKRSARQAVMDTVMSYASSNKYIIKISIEVSGETISYGRDSSAEAPNIQKEINAVAQQTTGAVRWISSSRDDSSLLCVRPILKTENLSLKNLGLLTVRLDFAKMIADIQSELSEGNDTQMYIWQANTLVYPLEGKDGIQLRDHLSINIPYQILQLSGEKYFVVNKATSNPKLTCIVTTKYNQIFQSAIFSNLIFILIIVFFTVTSIVVSNFLAHSILVHINTLIEKINSFKNGKPQKSPPKKYRYEQRHDELGILHQEFDSMVQRINQLIEQNYVKQLLIKDTQLKMLEAQINPHFLFNTLESINWQAKINKEDTISQMTESLGALLRYSFGEKSDLVPLSKELSILKSYMQIQQIRFDDRLKYSYRVAENLSNTLIPKMSIQPLVENAIKYALEQITDVCIIEVSVERKDDDIRICVKNNGSKIDPNILLKLKSGEIQPNGSGVGLENINQRIRLLYGSDYGLSFENEKGNAIVILTIPFVQSQLPSV
jgi:two-component system, sensor histidine kinase YesM